MQLPIKTKAAKHTSNPEWNEVFDFEVQPDTEILTFTVFDKNTMAKDEVIGIYALSATMCL